MSSSRTSSLRIDPRFPPKDSLYRIYDRPSAIAAARLPRGTIVRLDIPGVDPGEAARYEFSINAALRECGCRLSALFLVATICAAAVFDLLRWSFVRQTPVTAIATELLVAFVASGIGRAIGIARARRSLRRMLSTVGGLADVRPDGGKSWAV